MSKNRTNLLVVLLQEGDLLLDACDLHGQVGFGEGEVIQHPPESSDVSLNGEAHGQLCLISEIEKSILNKHLNRKRTRYCARMSVWVWVACVSACVLIHSSRGHCAFPKS